MRFETTLQDAPSKRSTPPTPVLRWLASPTIGVARDRKTVLKRGVMVIGRAVAEDGLPIENDPRVSRRHAEIEVSERGVRIVDLSSTRTTVNGKAVAEAELTDGDVLRLGDTFFLFRSKEDIEPAPVLGELLGDSPAIRAARRTLGLVGASDATVLLLGETGTGKELAARAIHQASGRQGAFVPVNCAAIAESLAESHLFGHVAGAFTGAKTDSQGVFRAADGGTLFLDEIGELSATLQPKFLRALEDKQVVPVGGTKPITCDVRVVAATNRDLGDAVSSRSFRSDLYARLTEFTVEMPPLRDRREDILPLLMGTLGEPVPTLEPDLIEALLIHRWPFNVRELVKVAKELRLRAAGVLTFDRSMFEPHLKHTPSERPAPPAQAAAPAPSTSPPEGTVDVGPIPDRHALEALLKKHRGVVADVARDTGRSRKQVYRWLEQHHLNADTFRA